MLISNLISKTKKNYNVHHSVENEFQKVTDYRLVIAHTKCQTKNKDMENKIPDNEHFTQNIEKSKQKNF